MKTSQFFDGIEYRLHGCEMDLDFMVTYDLDDANPETSAVIQFCGGKVAEAGGRFSRGDELKLYPHEIQDAIETFCQRILRDYLQTKLHERKENAAS